MQLARFEEPLSAGVVCVFTLGHTDLTREDTKSCPLLEPHNEPSCPLLALSGHSNASLQCRRLAVLLSQSQSQAPWMHRQLR